MAQHIDHRPLDLIGRNTNDAILNIAVRFIEAGRINAYGIALEPAGQGGNILGNGCREQKRAPLGRGRIKNELEILTKAEIKHLIGLVEHGNL